MATQDRNPYFLLDTCTRAYTHARTQRCAECNNLVPLCSLHDDHHVSTCHNHGDRSESCVPRGICIGTCILCFKTDKLRRIPIPTLRFLSHWLVSKFYPAQKDVHWGCRFAWRRCFNRQVCYYVQQAPYIVTLLVLSTLGSSVNADTFIETKTSRFSPIPSLFPGEANTYE